jgi:hypothetical protein
MKVIKVASASVGGRAAEGGDCNGPICPKDDFWYRRHDLAAPAALRSINITAV